MSGMSYEQFEAQMNILAQNVTAMQYELHETEKNMAKIWRVTASIFVFFMQLGFSLLEAGTVRFKNTRNIMIKNVLDTCVCAIAFWMFGYAIGFGDGSQFLGWYYPKRDEEIALAGNMDGIDGVQFFFQFTFAATSTTIIAGAVAERTHLWAYLLYNFFLSSLIYPVIAHIVWSEHGFLSASRHATILGTDGVLDNAGSMVVHVTGGVTSLVGAWMVGPRIGRYDIEGNPVPFKGHSMVYMAAGTLILWVGFFAFNGGSIELTSQSPSVWAYTVAHVCVNTTISAAFSGFTTFALTYRTKEPSPEDTFNAVIGGLVAACATSSIVRPYASAIIGIGAGLSYQVGVWTLAKLKIDDVVQAVPTHLFCGSWGAIAVGFFATSRDIHNTYGIEPQAQGLFYGKDWNLLGVQILGLLLVYAWVGSTSFALFYILHFFGVLRVKRQEEEVGLDVAFHGGEQTSQGRESVEGSPVHRFVHLSRNRSKLLSTSLRRWLTKAVFPRKRKSGSTKGDATGYSRGGRREVWYKALEWTAFGHFSLAMYEANYVMEDTGEVEASSSGVYIGVHDGHGGVEVAEYLKDNLYRNLTDQFILRGGGVSAEALRMAFAETDSGFKELAREAFSSSPHLATVGACSITCIVTANAIWVANVGDCRAVLGQVRRSESGERECRALQLSVDHNLKVPAIREEFEKEHVAMPDAVVEKKGSYRVKGKVTVTKAFGDLYLKSRDFNREPLFARFRVPEPFNPPLLTAEPTVAVRLLSPHDAFAIVASDGLFDYISNQEAVDIVASSPKKDVARKLIRAAIQRAADRHEIPYQDLLRMSSGQRREYHDDMTVVVFFFDHNVQAKNHRNNKWDLEASSQGHMNARAVLAERVQSMEDLELISTHHGGISAKNLLMGKALTMDTLDDTITDVKES